MDAPSEVDSQLKYILITVISKLINNETPGMDGLTAELYKTSLTYMDCQKFVSIVIRSV